jgi:hypothetical protein
MEKRIFGEVYFKGKTASEDIEDLARKSVERWIEQNVSALSVHYHVQFYYLNAFEPSSYRWVGCVVLVSNDTSSFRGRELSTSAEDAVKRALEQMSSFGGSENEGSTGQNNQTNGF